MTKIKVSVTYFRAETIADLLTKHHQLFNSSGSAFEWMSQFIPDLKLGTKLSPEMHNFFVEKAREYHQAPLGQAARGRILELLNPTVGLTVKSVGFGGSDAPYMELTNGVQTLFVSFHDHCCQWRGWPDVVDAAITDEPKTQSSYVPTDSATVLHFAGILASDGYFPDEPTAVEYVVKFFQHQCHLSEGSRLSTDNQLEVLFALDQSAIAN